MSSHNPGSYLLLLELSSSRTIQVGKLGSFLFPAGWYVYAGSALGGLEARVARHQRPSSVRRWHLDYLRAEAIIEDAVLFPGPGRRECELARALLAMPGASIPAPRFGASDCRCPTHLVRFSARPSLEFIAAASGGAPLARLANEDSRGWGQEHDQQDVEGRDGGDQRKVGYP